MTSAGSRAFSCRTPPRAPFTPYHSPTPAGPAMTPTSRFPATTGYYHPVMYPAMQYGGSPNKQRKGRGKFDDSNQGMLPDSTTLTPPSILPMKKSPVQVSNLWCL